jgi:hypothetical protein
MSEKPSILEYAGRTTPNDSRRARRMIALALFLLLAGLLFLVGWMIAANHW